MIGISQEGGKAMEWIRENWFFIIFFIFFMAMHLFGFGCGGHGGHQGHGGEDKEHRGHGEGSTRESEEKGGR